MLIGLGQGLCTAHRCSSQGESRSQRGGRKVTEEPKLNNSPSPHAFAWKFQRLPHIFSISLIATIILETVEFS